MSKQKVMKSVLIVALAFSLLTDFAVGAEPSVKLRPRGGMQRRNFSFKPTAPAKKPAAPVAKVVRPVPVRKILPAVAALTQPPEEVPDVQPVKIALFPKDGNVPMGTLNSIVISSRVVAARLEKKDDFQYYARRMRVLISGTKYVTLRLSDLDLVSGWMLFAADENLPFEAPATFPRSLPAVLGTTFGYLDQWEFAKDWGTIIDRVRSDRQIASKLTPGMIIERELSEYDQKNLSKLAKGGRKIEIDKFSLSPMSENFLCNPASVKLKNESNQLVSGASAVSCKSPGAEGTLGVRIESGVIDFWANREFTNASQSRLLENLAAQAFKDHKLESEKADNSTHSVCQKAQLTDSSLEIHYCTRTLRAAPNFQDTVAVFGRRSRAKFLYTVLRTGAMSESNTKKALELVMNALEENP